MAKLSIKKKSLSIDFEIANCHKPLLGRLAKLTDFGVTLEKEYEELFGIGNYYQALGLFHYCHSKDKYEISLMFIDETPIKRGGVLWYCLKDVGKYAEGNFYWFTLNQLMICNEF